MSAPAFPAFSGLGKNINKKSKACLPFAGAMTVAVLL